eukprot:4169266-Alexandrium_andersonii.AAC.1
MTAQVLSVGPGAWGESHRGDRGPPLPRRRGVGRPAREGSEIPSAGRHTTRGVAVANASGGATEVASA